MILLNKSRYEFENMVKENYTLYIFEAFRSIYGKDL